MSHMHSMCDSKLWNTWPQPDYCKLTTSLSTDAFLMAFGRFTARRALPKAILRQTTRRHLNAHLKKYKDSRNPRLYAIIWPTAALHFSAPHADKTIFWVCVRIIKSSHNEETRPRYPFVTLCYTSKRFNLKELLEVVRNWRTSSWTKCQGKICNRESG